MVEREGLETAGGQAVAVQWHRSTGDFWARSISIWKMMSLGLCAFIRNKSGYMNMILV